MEKVIESKFFLTVINESINLYNKFGARSNKKTNNFHNYVKKHLEKELSRYDGYIVKTEQNLESINTNNKKRCDIVIYKDNIPFIVFPVKIIMSNYKQNANNYFENLVGETFLLKNKNENLHIIPINIFFNKTPYLTKDRKIKKIENIDFDTISHYSFLKTSDICYNCINYLLVCENGICLNFDINTKYIPFNDIIRELLLENIKE